MIDVRQLTPRERDRSKLREALREAAMAVPGGAWDGQTVVRLEAVLDALSEPLEAASDYASEVRTDGQTHARLVVWAACPLCDVAQPLVLTVAPRLTVEDDSREIKLVGKTKARTHVCGQEVLPLAGGIDDAIRMWSETELGAVDDGDAPSEPTDDGEP